MSSRTIIVTGASSGIGAHCARALKADGWQVFATARKATDLRVLAEEGLGGYYLDYTQPESIRSLAGTVLELTGGRIDALFNNGAYAQAGAVEDLPAEALRLQLEANLIGWHDLTCQIIPSMRARGHGRIVHCSSILGLVPAPFRGAYCASKYALEGLMTCQRLELASSGIHVSMIEPGPVTSSIASNGLYWFEHFIDVGNSVHREAYQDQLNRLRSGGTKSRFKLGPEAVYDKLRHALESRRPKPHYVVTFPARMGVMLKRLLPAWAFYKIMARQG